MKEVKTLVQLSSENRIHPQQLTDWKTIALRGLPCLFETACDSEAKLKASYDQQQQELYAEIGKLTTLNHPGIISGYDPSFYQSRFLFLE